METSIKIFIVDDDVMFLDALEHYIVEEIKGQTVEIYKFIDGDECLQNLPLKPDIILLDYYLDPNDIVNNNGLAYLKKIKNSAPEIPVVIISGQDNVEIALEIINNGAYDYVNKNESAFVRIAKIVSNINDRILTQNTLKKKFNIYNIINLGIIIMLILLYFISHYL